MGKRAMKRKLSDEENSWLLNESDPDDLEGLGFVENDNHSDDELLNPSDTQESSESENSASSDDDGEESVPGARSGVGGGETYCATTWGPCNGRQQTFDKFVSEIVNLGASDEGIDPVQCYKLFLTDDVIELMVRETNKNAQQVLHVLRVKRSSRLKDWVDTTPEEMRVFLAIRLWMGLVVLPSFENYWSEDPVYYTQTARKAMKRNRFQLLLRFWHFSDNSLLETSKVAKVQPLLDLMHRNFSAVKTPGEVLVIDGSMVPWRGRLSFRQYLPGKAHKYGVKLFKICDDTGYTYKTIVYAGKGTVDQGSGEHLATKVVLQIMTPYVDSGRTLCTDNFYTSIPLAEQLLEKKTHLIGTVRKNRKGLPKDVIGAKLKKGQMKAAENEKGITVLKWRDQRDVCMLSTKHDDKMEQTGKKNRHGVDVVKPSMVLDYNRAKRCVDLADMLASYYCAQKTVRWYHKVADDVLFGTSVVNALLLYNDQPSTRVKMTLQSFRREIVAAWLCLPRSPLVSTPKPESHYLKKVYSKQGQRITRNRCRGCYDKLSKEKGVEIARKQTKRVSTICENCDSKPFLCVECFKEFHEKS